MLSLGKRRFLRSASLLFLFIFSAQAIFAHPGHAADEHLQLIEQIEDFAVDITLQPDTRLSVEERIQYSFGPEEKHGIYRDIPIKYESRMGARESITVEVESVTDERGKPVTFTEERTGGFLKIKIGDADRLITGTHTYIIRYSVRGAVRFLDGFDEIYWNVTGHDWLVPMVRASVTVRTPFMPDRSRFTCYVGARGSTARCDQDAVIAPAAGGAQGISLSWQEILEPGSGVTVALGFDKGLLREPNAFEKTLAFLQDNPLVPLPVMVFVAMLIHWYRFGRDPEGRGTIIPEYDVPEHLSSLEVAALMHGKVTGKDISAAIVDLAVQGYLRIEKTVEDKLIFDKTEYTLHRLPKAPATDSLEEALLTALFSDGLLVTQKATAQKILETQFASIFPQLKTVVEKSLSAKENEMRPTVKLSELKNKFYTKIAVLEKQALDQIVSKKLYAKNPKDVWGKYVLWGILFFIVGFLVVPHLGLGALDIVAALLSIPIYITFAALMPQVTRQGAIVKERLLGLKDYLQIAEKDRLEFHNAPAKTPELFEKLLPAAMLLGVSEIWAKEFADIYTRPPEWYSSASGAHFSALAFSSDMDGFSSASSSTLASAPSSSGSGGGGSSGGGSGGGGGGSW